MYVVRLETSSELTSFYVLLELCKIKYGVMMLRVTVKASLNSLSAYCYDVMCLKYFILVLKTDTGDNIILFYFMLKVSYAMRMLF